MLYFVNTLGSALAGFTTAAYLLGILGQQRTVAVAASLNLLVENRDFQSSRGSPRRLPSSASSGSSARWPSPQASIFSSAPASFSPRDVSAKPHEFLHGSRRRGVLRLPRAVIRDPVGEGLLVRDRRHGGGQSRCAP